jgi:hypothetical protein
VDALAAGGDYDMAIQSLRGDRKVKWLIDSDE